ncbi:MAG: conjugative transposon protein TraM [Paludibacteraceae bacterium]|nr:conjugative transposon protein TraM [Paludibacteraceae bacterium]
MSRKTLTIHLYCLFLFIGGCGIFWLFGGGDGDKTGLEDNKAESTAQQTTDNIATTWEEQSDASTDDDDADAEPSSTIPSTSQESPEKTVCENKGKAVTKTDSERSASIDKESTMSSEAKTDAQDAGFHQLVESDNAIRVKMINAVIHEKQKSISTESPIKLRLLDDVTVEGVCIPKNTVVFAKVRLAADRIYLKTETVTYKKKDYPIDADIYDVDGLEGLKVTDKKLALPAGYKVIIKRK